ncbi:hypothetical protein QQZ08_008888 [Neonectria magnoliae]|uniref:SRPBCC family protein n=1 Tax=Neonectria magnoliae TaxID=2732573 RepID=A0ABR1HSP6_9HYPO
MAGIISKKIPLGQVTRTFKSPIARTWALWSSFGAAHLYIAGCDAVELQGFGVGSVRVLSIYGGKVQETLAYVDPKVHTFGYSIANSPGLPVVNPFGQIQLRELGKSETQITWTGFADSVTPGAENSMKEQLAKLYNDSIDKARKTLEAPSE